MIQTAEGALNEAHSILQRMNELAVQGANDTNQSIDRDAINQELEALTDEIDRISQTTQFNKQNLLDGNFKDKKLQVGANANQNIEISIDSMNADALGLGKEQVKQGGTTPTAVKYQGMSYKYSQKILLLKMQVMQFHSLKNLSLRKLNVQHLSHSMIIQQALFITKQQLMVRN